MQFVVWISCNESEESQLVQSQLKRRRCTVQTPVLHGPKQVPHLMNAGRHWRSVNLQRGKNTPST